MPFEYQTICKPDKSDHLNTGLVRYSDCSCIRFSGPNYVNVLPDRSGFLGHQCILLQQVWRQFQRVSEPRKNGTNYSGDLESGLFKGQISNSPVFKWLGFCYGFHPNHTKFLSRFQMIFDKMSVICQDFKWLGFQISETFRKPDHLQPNLFSTIQNQD